MSMDDGEHDNLGKSNTSYGTEPDTKGLLQPNGWNGGDTLGQINGKKSLLNILKTLFIVLAFMPMVSTIL